MNKNQIRMCKVSKTTFFSLSNMQICDILSLSLSVKLPIIHTQNLMYNPKEYSSVKKVVIVWTVIGNTVNQINYQEDSNSKILVFDQRGKPENQKTHSE